MTQIEQRPLETKIDSRAVIREAWLAVGLFILGVGAALVAVLGPLVTEMIRYHASEGAVNQVVGGDVAGLVLMAPMSVLAGVLVWRGHRAGPILALGPAFYALYVYTQLAIGADFSRYEGNSEMFFPLFLGLFILAAAIAVKSWTVIDSQQLPAISPTLDRTIGGFFLVVAFFLTFGLHLPGLTDVWSGDPASSEYLADPVVFWLVKLMDLGLVVPALVTAGIGVLRRRPWARKIEYAMVGWTALLGASVAGMAIVMQATGDPAATAANTVVFTGFAGIAIGLAVLVYRPLFDHNRRRVTTD